MSQVKWCDIGQHPFPEGQPGCTTLKVEQYVRNQWGGSQPQDIIQDVCAACARDAGIKRMSEVSTGMSDAETDALADSIRDGTAGSRFRKNLTRALTAAHAPASTKDPEEARAKGYDPDYVAWLEEQANKALVPE